MRLSKILRTGHVTRWHIVRTKREQTLAEHSYRVTMIADFLAELCLPSLRYKQNQDMIMEYALYHDITEVVTGDVATPTKRLAEFDDKGLCPRFDELDNAVFNTPMKEIVKLADFIEAILFLHIEGIGVHAEKVKCGIQLNFKNHLTECQSRWPEIHWYKAEEELKELYKHV